ncbi:hypothetical protein ACROYT_G031168 [Oculina patagonica]
MDGLREANQREEFGQTLENGLGLDISQRNGFREPGEGTHDCQQTVLIEFDGVHFRWSFQAVPVIARHYSSSGSHTCQHFVWLEVCAGCTSIQEELLRLRSQYSLSLILTEVARDITEIATEKQYY